MAFADVIKLWWDHPGVAQALNPVTGVLIRRERFQDTQRHREKAIWRQAESGVMLLHAKESQEPQGAGRSEAGFSTETSEGARPCKYFYFGPLPPKLGQSPFLMSWAVQSVRLCYSSWKELTEKERLLLQKKFGGGDSSQREGTEGK